MRQVLAAALVVLVLEGCSGGGGSSAPVNPGPFVPLGEPSPTGRFLPQHLAIAWLDDDAFPDVALPDGIHPEVRVLLGAADGSFTLLAPHSFGIPDDPSPRSCRQPETRDSVAPRRRPPPATSPGGA